MPNIFAIAPITGNEARARSGEYLPFVGLRAGAGTEKVGRYTRDGAIEENLPLKDGGAFPEPPTIVICRISIRLAAKNPRPRQ